MDAIFDLRHAQTWSRILSSLYVFPDPGNMAVGISLLSCVSADICATDFFEVAILAFWLPLTYPQLTIIVITPVDCPNMYIWG